MADREVKVRISADIDPYARKLAEAAAETKAFSKEVSSSGRSFESFQRDLQTTGERMNSLAAAGLALTPALVPIGATAVPAIAGLSTQLGFAVAAAGTAVLAFHGVGTALKAANEAAVEPTAANLGKLNEAMAHLSPAGQAFVHQLQALEPQLKQLQGVAQAGLFPGVDAGIEHLLTLMPQAEQIIATVSSTLGDLADKAGAGLAGPEFSEFFSYIERDARPILEDLGSTIGHVAAGIANLFVAFEPSELKFSAALKDMAKDFDSWTAGLSKTKGFQEFIAYLDTNGPKVAKTVGAVSKALVDVVEAMAPIGSVELPIIKAFAEALGAVAKSPVGPVLVGAAVAMVTLTKAMAAFKALGGAGGVGAGGASGLIGRTLGVDTLRSVPGTYRAVAKAMDDLRAAELRQAEATKRYAGWSQAGALIPTEAKRQAARDFVVTQQQTAAATERVAAAERTRSEALKGSAIAGGKAAAGIAGVALASSGATDKIGLTNTATLALAGTMIEPGLGTAIGAFAGGLLDIKDSSDKAAASQKSFELALKSRTTAQLQANKADLESAGSTTSHPEGPNPAALRQNIVTPGRDDAKLAAVNKELELRGAAQGAANAQALAHGFSVLSVATGLATESTQKFSAGLSSLNSQISTFSGATSFHSALLDINDALKTNGKTLDINTRKGQANRDSLSSLASAATSEAQNLENSGKRLEAVRLLSNAQKDLSRAAQSMGATKRQADVLAKRLLGLDVSINPVIKLSGADNAILKSGNLLNELKVIDKVNAKAKVSADTKEAYAEVRSLVQMINAQHPTVKIRTTTGSTAPGAVGHAAGGPITGPAAAQSTYERFLVE